MRTEERDIVEAVRRFVAREVTPHVEALEARTEAPEPLLVQLRDLGLFGLAVPEPFGGLGLSLPAKAAVMEALATGWTTLAARLNSHATVCHLIARNGTQAQQARYLPRLASGELRGALSLTEPGAGSDLQAIRTAARRDGDVFRVTGDKIFVTNGRRAGLLAVLVKTDPKAVPPHRGMSLLLVEQSDAGVVVGADLPKMAYGHVDTCEVSFDQARVPANRLLGEEGRGLAVLLEALELGRILIAASAVGLAQAALDQALAYARTRQTFGRPIGEHQAIRMALAEMATRVEAARRLTLHAAAEKEELGRADMASGMAKLFASEAALEVATAALRIHGGYGYIRGQAVERLYREAPLYIVGEGTNEIQKLVIARRLLSGEAAP